MDSWTKKEKLKLLNGLYKHGPGDLKVLKKMIGTKSELEIRKRILLYKEHASKSKAKPKIFKKLTGRHVVWPNDILANKWASVISHWSNIDSRETAIPEALRLIANLENHPSPEEYSMIDLKSLYLYLADIIEGKTPTNLNSVSRELLINTLLNLTLRMKESLDPDVINFVENITRIYPNIIKPEMTTSTSTSQALSELLSSIAYNPLAIPEKFLYPNKNNDY